MKKSHEELKENPLTKQTIYEGRIFSVEEHMVELPNGKKARRDIVRNPNAVAVVAIDEEGRVAMVYQYRLTAESVTFEIPAGKMDPGEQPQETAFRELREETGLQAQNMEHLMSIRVSPGFSTEIIHVFLATGLSAGKMDPDEDEFVAVETVPIEELISAIIAGKIQDGKTVSGILAAARKLGY